MSPRLLKYTDLQKHPSVCPSHLQGPAMVPKIFRIISTNSSRFSCTWNNPNEQVVLNLELSLLFLICMATAVEPQAAFRSHRSSSGCSACPAHNALTRCQHGRQGCKVTTSNCGTLCLLHSISDPLTAGFTRADIFTDINWETKPMLIVNIWQPRMLPFYNTRRALFTLESTLLWLKLTLEP